MDTVVAEPVELKVPLLADIAVSVAATGGAVVGTLGAAHLLVILVLVALRTLTAHCVTGRQQVERRFTLLTALV